MNKLPVAFLCSVLFASFAFAQSGMKIDKESAGSVKIGMTVADARKAMSGFTFARTSDGEGMALIAVSKGKNMHMFLYAGEDDPEGAISESAKIEHIEVVGKEYATADGVSPGMKISDVEKKLGKVSEITISEIEAREYAEFTNSTSDMSYRLANEDGMAGKYAENETRTLEYNPGAFIYSISISAPFEGGPMDGHESLMTLIEKAVGEFEDMKSRGIGIVSEFADDNSKLTIVITDDGYADDSVRGKRTTLMVEKDENGKWQIKSSEEAWKCWEGRGHTDFQPKPCI